ncbi:c-type cytochrome [Saprospira grandis]|uniref:c-type cytochrome n=1 Tax=Saprospira grandis TaxID=1008 RepID=UPI0022DD23BC|nr:cytochrome c [Saprospira grandis]WBM75753.1 cytochrome c [Saprospira grandis]
MKLPNLYFFAAIALSAFFLGSCGKSGGEFAGYEYMPDMGHSIAYEANVNTYYRFNTHSSEEEYHEFAKPRKPVAGTVPFNATATTPGGASEFTFPVYAFDNTEAGRNEAMKAITENPLKAKNEEDLKKILAKGEELYVVYCASCHGEEGDGNGQLWNSGDGPYPNAPANYMTDDLKNATDGRYYHAIMHGKGVMLSHADKLSHDERWMVIHYIRSLQAEKYDLPTANGQNKVATPDAEDTEAEAAATEEENK